MKTTKKHKVSVLTEKDYEDYLLALANGLKVDVPDEVKKD